MPTNFLSPLDFNFHFPLSLGVYNGETYTFINIYLHNCVEKQSDCEPPSFIKSFSLNNTMSNKVTQLHLNINTISSVNRHIHQYVKRFFQQEMF